MPFFSLPRWMGVPLGIAVTLLIAGLGVGGLLMLNRLAEDAHSADQILTRLEIQTARLHSWERRVVRGQTGPDELPTIRDRADEMTQGSEQLERLAGSEVAATQLIGALDDYRATLDKELHAVSSGDCDLTSSPTAPFTMRSPSCQTARCWSIVCVRPSRAVELSVTAEGIESVDQLAELLDLSCDEGQGFYFARPQTSEAMDRLLKVGLVELGEFARAA